MLASGDGDFVPLVEYLKMNGCQVEVITFGKSASGKLKEAADDFIDLDDDPNKYVLGNNRFNRDRREFPKKEERREERREEHREHKDTRNEPQKQGTMRKVIRKLR